MSDRQQALTERLNQAMQELVEVAKDEQVLFLRRERLKGMIEGLRFGMEQELVKDINAEPDPVIPSRNPGVTTVSEPDPNTRAGKALSFLRSHDGPAHIGTIAGAQGLPTDVKGRAIVTTAISRYINKGLFFVRIGDGIYGLKGRDDRGGLTYGEDEGQ